MAFITQKSNRRSSNFNYVEKINFNWTLSNESQKIENYNTQKQQQILVDENGTLGLLRIPINDGTYKFLVSRVLIVKIEDSEKNIRGH